MTEIIAIIPARGGSKSIPKKNIINLGGYPLIAYTIIAARSSKYIDRVIVSTDSQEIAKIAKRYGAEVPFLRPKKFAGDNSPDIGYIWHMLNWLEKHEKYVPDMVIHLRPTTPLRDYKIIDKAILEIIKDKKATSLRSAHVSKNTGYKIFKKKGHYIDFFGKEDFKKNEEYYNYCRQLLPKTYIPNGYVDIILPKIMKKTGTLHGKNIRAFITQKVADLDTFEDLEFAKEILKNKEFLPLVRLLNKTKNMLR